MKLTQLAVSALGALAVSTSATAATVVYTGLSPQYSETEVWDDMHIAPFETGKRYRLEFTISDGVMETADLIRSNYHTTIRDYGLDTGGFIELGCEGVAIGTTCKNAFLGPLWTTLTVTTSGFSALVRQPVYDDYGKEVKSLTHIRSIDEFVGWRVNVDYPISYRLAVTEVPEPATWAMLILGFGAIGGALRSRRQMKLAR